MPAGIGDTNSRSTEIKFAVDIFSWFFHFYIGVIIISLGGIKPYVVYFLRRWSAQFSCLNESNINKVFLLGTAYKHLPVQSQQQKHWNYLQGQQ